MKISSLCTCGQYAPVVADYSKMRATADCRCGITTVQEICPLCQGSHWRGLEVCACDLGLVNHRTTIERTILKPPETIEFGVKIPRKRTSRTLD